MHVLRQKAVCSDSNVRSSMGKFFQTFFDFFITLKTTEQTNRDRKALHSLDKIVINLLRKNRRRAKIGHLLGILHRFKGCSKRNLRFPVADVSADQPVHDFAAFHIVFGGFYGKNLVSRLFVRKCFFKFLLPNRILRETVAFLILSPRIEF